MKVDTEIEILRARDALVKIGYRLDDAMITTLFNTAIEALQKQIPKSPDEDYEETLDGEYFNGYKCPVCKHHIDYGGAYCSSCGQALDWQEAGE